MKKLSLILALTLTAPLLSGCVVGAVVGTGAAVVGGAAKVTGAVVGAGIDAAHTSDEELREKREKEERRCERRQRKGKDC